MEIKRITSYDDPRFDIEVLKQRCAFLVANRYLCSFRILDQNSATLLCEPHLDVDALIEEFRFYAEHITRFFEPNGDLIREFPPLDVFEVNIADIQPSQFVVDLDKVAAISTFIHKGDDVIVPVATINGHLASLDGHTRLYYAAQRGFNQVKGFFTEPGEYTAGFVAASRTRGVYSPFDLTAVPHDAYKREWHKFCDDFFASGKQQEQE